MFKRVFLVLGSLLLIAVLSSCILYVPEQNPHPRHMKTTPEKMAAPAGK
ncbi:MAG: hypothetical protein MUP81_01885 [Dehalococcoidia bacterium]|nr:hypothetical protein [Dehalococcoidia bacterium]